VLTVEPGLGVQVKHAKARLAVRDDLGDFHKFRQGGGEGGLFGRTNYNVTFVEPGPEGAGRPPLRAADGSGLRHTDRGLLR
jgi:hypothetical protein